jgi:hypothetical protein
MPSDIDKIVDGFPHPTVIPITGVPTYEAIAELNLQLNANAASVQSNLGDGLLGLLFLTITPAEYNTLSAVQFIPPGNPGSTPVIPAGSTGPQISAVIRQHGLSANLFKEYLATDKALKQQIIGAVPATYLRTLRNRITGFANVTTLQLLSHLYTNYGRLSPADLQDNDTRMRNNYDPNQPIEAFIDQIEDAISLAAAANAPYTAAQIVAIAYNIIFSTGMFPEACREWRRRPIVEKTWVNFKVDFALAHQDFRDSQVTSRQAGYHNANAAFELQQDTATAIANLATATAADRSTVANLTSTNSNLTIELAQTTAKLASAQASITALQIELATLKTNPSNRNNREQREPRTYTPNSNYCWSHGYKVNSSHTSSTCSRPRTGHQSDATREDNKGGSQRGKE